MGHPTPIEWTDATWNPIGGCSIKSPGCIHCYAQQLAGTRLAKHPLYAGTTDIVKGKPVFNGKLTTLPNDAEAWTWPLRWRGAKAPLLGAGQPSCIFVGDMSDLFHEDRHVDVIDRVFAVMGLAAGHIFQVLTKRPDRARAYMTEHFGKKRHICDFALGLSGGRTLWAGTIATQINRHGYLPNVWLGTSAERQQEADARIPELLATPAAVRFVSLEPLLGPIDLRRIPHEGGIGSVLEPAEIAGLVGNCIGVTPALDWVIVGGESGQDARPVHPDWVRSLRDQCTAAEVPFFFKQWGEFLPDSQRTGIPEPHEEFGIRVGKKAAGRLLDGRECNELPSVGVRASGSYTTPPAAETP
jgi:protein gp37